VRRGCQPVGPMVWRSALWTLNPATAAQIRVGPYLMLAGRAGSIPCISIWVMQFTTSRGHRSTCFLGGLKSVAAQILAAWMACCAGGAMRRGQVAHEICGCWALFGIKGGVGVGKAD
jgi:hypothetical protein